MEKQWAPRVLLSSLFALGLGASCNSPTHIEDPTHTVVGKIETMTLPSHESGVSRITIATPTGEHTVIEVPYRKETPNATLQLEIQAYNKDTDTCSPDTDNTITGPTGEENPDTSKKTTPWDIVSFTLPDRHGDVRFNIPSSPSPENPVTACVEQEVVQHNFDDGCDRLTDPKLKIQCDK
jgi:hypothetical protein